MAFLDNSGVTTLVTRLKTYFALKNDVPAAYTGNPKMDGTASAGSGTSYARGNHVHPHDTSRVPTSTTINGKALSSNVTLSASDVGAQATLVSGTNIKTINGESILGSGDITVGGGGGGSSFLISMTYDDSSISNVSYNGATATEIAEAVVNDPTTRVVFALDVGSNQGVVYCTPSNIQAKSDPIFPDIRVVVPMCYSSGGGGKSYLLELRYIGEKWRANKRATWATW